MNRILGLPDDSAPSAALAVVDEKLAARPAPKAAVKSEEDLLWEQFYGPAAPDNVSADDDAFYRQMFGEEA